MYITCILPRVAHPIEKKNIIGDIFSNIPFYFELKTRGQLPGVQGDRRPPPTFWLESGGNGDVIDLVTSPLLCMTTHIFLAGYPPAQNYNTYVLFKRVVGDTTSSNLTSIENIWPLKAKMDRLYSNASPFPLSSTEVLKPDSPDGCLLARSGSLLSNLPI